MILLCQWIGVNMFSLFFSLMSFPFQPGRLFYATLSLHQFPVILLPQPPMNDCAFSIIFLAAISHWYLNYHWNSIRTACIHTHSSIGEFCSCVKAANVPNEQSLSVSVWQQTHILTYLQLELTALISKWGLTVPRWRPCLAWSMSV